MSDAGWFQECVREFHVMTGAPAPDRMAVLESRRELRARLIREELNELVDAMGLREDMDGDYQETEPPDVLGCIDALCDLLYVVFGTAVEMGIPLERFFAEVHRSNMTKTAGAQREDGKTLKGPGYEPPRLKPMLDRLRGRQDG